MQRSVSVFTTAAMAAILFVLPVLPMRADQVQLNNGDILRGTVVDRDAQGLILDHAVLGHLTIPAADVRSVLITPRQETPTAPPVTRTTTTSVIQRAESSAPVQPATTGDPTTAPAADGPARSPLIPPAAQDPQYTRYNPLDPLLMESGLFTGPLPWPLSYLRREGYRTQIEFGFNGSEGQSETSALRAAFVTNRENVETRSHFDAIYNRATSGNDTTRNELNVRDQEDWLMPESLWYWFLQGTYDYNEFADWDHRISGATGPGYHLIRTATFDLRVRAGLGGSKEFGSDDENLIPEGLLGGEFIWKLSPRQKLAASTVFYPDLLDPTINRSVSSADWSYLLDQARRLSLKFGTRLEYASQTSDDTPNSDLKFFGALVFAF